MSNYRTHTLHCARNVTKCPDCDAKVTKESMSAHYQDAHTLRLCDLCHISVEAFKLPEHKVGSYLLIMPAYFCTDLQTFAKIQFR